VNLYVEGVYFDGACA